MAERAAVPADVAVDRYLDATAKRERAILAEELDARADTLELMARSGGRTPAMRGASIEDLGKRVRVLRAEAGRLRGHHG